jgi:hypothetical protein
MKKINPEIEMPKCIWEKYLNFDASIKSNAHSMKYFGPSLSYWLFQIQ